MLRNFILFVLLSFGAFSTGISAQTIELARDQSVGSTVTVRGIVTSGAELGKIRYMQDATAGIALFPGTGSVSGFDGSVFPGDSIEATGTLVEFHGLLEINPITAYTVFTHNLALPAPKVIGLSELSDDYESQLVAFECVHFNNGGGVFSSGGVYDVSDPDGTLGAVYLRSGHPMLNTAIPSQPIRLETILSEYDDFQLLPRTTNDLAATDCFYFTEKPDQSNIITNGFKVKWATSKASDCVLHFGTSPGLGSLVAVPGNGQVHEYTFNSLQPGTLYWLQVEAVSGGNTIFSPVVVFATESLSSGKIKVYFNKGYDPAFANGYTADGTTIDDVTTEIIDRINSAQHTIDVCMYNNSRATFVNALRNAQNRGVTVRYVAALDASNDALQISLNFPVIYGNSSAIMHNKFMVIDQNDKDNCWVMSGSMNWTDVNMNNDFNNILFIQDQSLAKSYTLEFAEMWGSNDVPPNPSASRFGAEKRDNTAHHFVIGGHAVESYFSPSDHTGLKIENAISSSQSELLFALFSFTKNELGEAIVQEHNQNVPVRGMIENVNDVGCEFDYMYGSGVNVRDHTLPGQLHHKYCVIDAYDTASDPTVVTGSHNWSYTAESANDENTLILHDPKVAALFKAEFEKRWGDLVVPVHEVDNQGFEVFPNPVSDQLTVRNLPASEGLVSVYNTLGQSVFQGGLQGENGLRLNTATWAPGQYFILFNHAGGVARLSFQKL